MKFNQNLSFAKKIKSKKTRQIFDELFFTVIFKVYEISSLSLLISKLNK